MPGWLAIEQVPEWGTGSIAAIRDGGAPRLVAEEEHPVPSDIQIIVNRLRDPAVPEIEKLITRELLRMIVQRDSAPGSRPAR